MTNSAGDALREQLRSVRGGMSGDHATRLHRAVSWLRCAEQYAEADEDVSFMTLWVAFNALYSVDGDGNDLFRDEFGQLVDKLVKTDREKEIYKCLWTNFPGFVRHLIENRYVDPAFWESQREGNDNWKGPFEGSKRRANQALAEGDVPRLLRIVMRRLYMLRNQLMHGGATWRSTVNRDQVRDGKRMLLELVPLFIRLMFDGSVDWGPVRFPVVD